MNKPREFWIEKEHWQKWYGGIRKYLSCFEEPQNEVEEYFHTIEYSAYEKLKEENEKMKTTLLKITELGCLYKGDLTGCAGCIVANDYPEFNELNKVKRSGEKAN